MKTSTKIINITLENAFKYKPGPSCFMNPKQEGARNKLDWMKARFNEGMISKVLFLEDQQKSAGFIEYIPGEQAWRAVDAPGSLFIHCIWVYPNDQKKRGYASILLQECIKDAKKLKKTGIAVITSEGAFMAGKDLFLNNGFIIAASEEPSFHLLAYQLKKRSLPKFRDWRVNVKKYHGLHILYSNQCPWVARSITELSVTAEKYGLIPTITEYKTAKEAQNSPSVYSTFNLVYNGRLLSDHYISKRRFENIIKQEILE
jgi:hypothetical protein